MSAPRIAFLGLGIMGGGMARRLLGAGFPVTVYNRNREKAASLAAAGARIAESPRVAATDAAMVFSMVADDAASRALWLGEPGALAGVSRGSVLVECSTLSVSWVKELASLAEIRGCEFIDAPVTGSKGAAAAGELNFIAGGSAAALEKIRPMLAAMGRSITHLGPTGSGALVKLINNFVCGVQLASIAEALAWIERSGLDRAKALNVLLEGAPGSPIVKVVTARMTAGDFTPNFLLKLMAKDLDYAGKESGLHGQPLETAACALQIFQRAIAAGHGDKDMAAVIEPLRRP
jgi:3-hydroxyisobutyrate dehydrogenase